MLGSRQRRNEDQGGRTYLRLLVGSMYVEGVVEIWYMRGMRLPSYAASFHRTNRQSRESKGSRSTHLQHRLSSPLRDGVVLVESWLVVVANNARLRCARVLNLHSSVPREDGGIRRDRSVAGRLVCPVLPDHDGLHTVRVRRVADPGDCDPRSAQSSKQPSTHLHCDCSK